VDVSSVVIEKMKQQYPDLECPSSSRAVLISRCHQGKLNDATSLSAFGSSTFDVAIDKGTLDALLCGPGSSNRAASMLGAIARVCTEFHLHYAKFISVQVLRPSGLLVEVTHSPLSARQSYFEVLNEWISCSESHSSFF
jgi:hypothetical protein